MNITLGKRYYAIDFLFVKAIKFYYLPLRVVFTYSEYTDEYIPTQWNKKKEWHYFFDFGYFKPFKVIDL